MNCGPYGFPKHGVFYLQVLWPSLQVSVKTIQLVHAGSQDFDTVPP